MSKVIILSIIYFAAQVVITILLASWFSGSPAELGEWKAAGMWAVFPTLVVFAGLRAQFQKKRQSLTGTSSHPK
jgi:hypothetical protein